MSAYLDQREDFRRMLAERGIRQAQQLDSNWQSLLPAHIREVWLQRYWRPGKQPLEPLGQFVNHFLLGADPEFYFYSQGGREDASNLGLKAGLAWGADNNGRLAELRPVPSRSALVVTASIGAELRWMSWLKRDLLNYQWRSGAWTGQDGLGGHIHFGRKRRTLTAAETSALDTLCFWLYQAGIFNAEEGRERYVRTRAHGNYGRPGDVRQQLHGYEYRSLPSWLDSPWLALFTLTLAKLVVFDPELVPRLIHALERESSARIRDRLAALLAYYQFRDDDAALVYALLVRHDFPHYQLGDFKPRWGIFSAPASIPPVQITPASVEPAESEILELRQALWAGRSLEPVNSQPTWTPSRLPTGFAYLPDQVQTKHAPGLGELVVGLCVVADNLRITAIGERAERIYVGKAWAQYFTPSYWKSLRKRFPEIEFNPTGDANLLQFATGFDYKKYGKAIRAWLLEGRLPIWRVEDVTTNSWVEWKARAGQLAKESAPAAPAKIYSKAL